MQPNTPYKAANQILLCTHNLCLLGNQNIIDDYHVRQFCTIILERLSAELTKGDVIMSTEIRVAQEDRYAFIDDMMMEKIKNEVRCWDWAHEFNEEREHSIDKSAEEHEVSRSTDFGMPGM